MAKKKDLPAMPFYFGDWRKAPEIRALDLDVRMIWFEMLGYMWESTERGYLTINGNPVTTSVITQMIGVLPEVLKHALDQLEQYGVFSKRKDGAIYCRKMVHDEEIRQAKSNAGKEGMKKRWSKKDKDSVITKPITNPENEIEIENKEKGVQGKKENGLEKENGSPSEQIVEWLRGCQGGMLDNTIDENIINCQDCLDKIEENHPTEDAKSFLCKLIQAGLDDSFHLKNMGSFRYIFKNLTKLLILYNQPDQ